MPSVFGLDGLGAFLLDEGRDQAPGVLRHEAVRAELLSSGRHFEGGVLKFLKTPKSNIKNGP